MPFSSLLDRFELDCGSPGRNFQLDGESATSRFGIVRKGLVNVETFQSVARQLRFPSYFRANPGDLFSAARKAPAFDEKNVAIGLPAFWQIEGKGQV